MKYLIRAAAIAAILVASSLLGGEKASPMVAGTPGYIDTLFVPPSGDSVLDVAVSADGTRVVATGRDVVYEFRGGQVRRLAGCVTDCVAASMLANNQPLNDPFSVALDTLGNVYIGESYGCRIQRVATDGTMSVIAGSPTGECGHSGDGGPATEAVLGVVSAVHVADNGDLYLSELWNESGAESCRIRRISGGVIQTVAGKGLCTTSGDGGDAMLADVFPLGLATAPDGSLYVAQADCRVRRISGGVISTIAGDGTCDWLGHGVPATDTGVWARDVAIDPSGVIYIASTCGVRKIEDGIIWWITDSDCSGTILDGPASLAVISVPEGLALDGAGNIYVADWVDSRGVRVIYGAAALDSDGDAYPDVVETGMGEDPFSYCAAMRADIDDDGVVSIMDLSIVATSFAQSVPPAPSRRDQDGDGAISILDLSRMARVFTEPVSGCP